MKQIFGGKNFPTKVEFLRPRDDFTCFEFEYSFMLLSYHAAIKQWSANKTEFYHNIHSRFCFFIGNVVYAAASNEIYPLGPNNDQSWSPYSLVSENETVKQRHA